MKSFVLEFFIAARFANLAVSLPQYQFASHRWFVPSFWRELIDSKGLRITWSNDLDLGDSPELVRELAHQGLWLEQEPLVVDSRIVSALEAML